MRRNHRFLGPILAVVVLAAPTLTAGCARHETYYDPEYRDYHRWNGDEVVLYRRWEGETRREHREFRYRSEREQREYWGWRHHNRDRDRDHDREHGRDHDRD